MMIVRVRCYGEDFAFTGGDGAHGYGMVFE